MHKLALVVCLTFAAIVAVPLTASAGVCFLCGSGSKCEQCQSGSGKDTQDDRKACEARGCKVNGTTSCSGAVNIKMCKLEKTPTLLPSASIPWCAPAGL
jgi:hypothetical protein